MGSEDSQVGGVDWDQSSLIDAAVDVLWNQVTAMLGGYTIERVWLEKIAAQSVKDGYMDEGYLNWNMLIASPYNRTAKSITIPYAVFKGKVQAAKYFTTPGGAQIPLTLESLQNFLCVGKRPGW